MEIWEELMMDNGSILRLAIEKQKEEVYDRKEAELKKFCDGICEQAIAYRLTNPNGRDYTGNLVNSIVVALYRRGRFVYATYSTDSIDDPIAPKMSGNGSGGYVRYYFDPDYDGAKSNYTASIVTDKGYGYDDARRFTKSYQASPQAIFEIVCAYTVEYAEFVEMQRQTTGYLNTVELVTRTAPKVITA